MRVRSGVFWRVMVASLGISFVMILAAHNTSVQSQGEPLNGLKLTIYPDPERNAPFKLPKFIAELRNTGNSDLILNLGAIVSGKQESPSVELTLTYAPGQSISISRQDGLGGPNSFSIKPLILPLPVGCAFTFP